MSRGVIAVVVCVAIVVAIVSLGHSNPPVQAIQPGHVEGPSPDPAHAINKLEVQSPFKVVLECENPTRLEDKDPKTGKVVLKIGKIMVGEPLGYLECPDGWIKTCGLDDLKGKPGALPGKAFYDFNVAEATDAYIFIRAKWMDSCGNSVYVRIDHGDYVMVKDTEGEVSSNVYQWAWHMVAIKAHAQKFSLTPGQHTLELAVREDGPLFDKVLLSSDATQPGRDVVNP